MLKVGSANDLFWYNITYKGKQSQTSIRQVRILAVVLTNGDKNEGPSAGSKVDYTARDVFAISHWSMSYKATIVNVMEAESGRIF